MAMLLSFLSVGQEIREILLSGRVLNREDAQPIPNVNVIIKNELRGTFTDEDGYFSMEVLSSDTILFSSIEYELKMITLDHVDSRKHFVQVLMDLRVYRIPEVEVEGLGNYDMLKRKIIEGENRRKSREREFVEDAPENNTERPEQVAPTIASPFDYLYQLWGKRPQELRELEDLERGDAYRTLLNMRFNQHIVHELTGLVSPDLERFMARCRFSEEFVYTASDYEFYLAILDYYQHWQLEEGR
jgi:hypothetical protein